MLDMGFALIILFCGLYILYAAIQMKNEKKINTSICRTPKNVGRKIKDTDGFINYLFPRLLGLAIFSIIVSFWFFMDDEFAATFGSGVNSAVELILIVLYLVSLFLYTKSIKKAEDKYC